MFGSALDPERTFDMMSPVGRTRVRRRRVALLVSLVVATAAWTVPRVAVGDPEGEEAAASSRYVVRSGDTLWSIARRFAPGEDPRPLVDALLVTNGVEAGALVPGQTLVVPSP
jgi:LysM repeat protein